MVEPTPNGMVRLPGNAGFSGEIWHYTDPTGNTADVTIQPNGVASISTDGQDNGSVSADFPPEVLRWLADLGQRIGRKAHRG